MSTVQPIKSTGAVTNTQTLDVPYTEGLQFIPSSTDEYTAIVAGMKTR